MKVFQAGRIAYFTKCRNEIQEVKLHMKRIYLLITFLIESGQILKPNLTSGSPGRQAAASCRRNRKDKS